MSAIFAILFVAAIIYFNIKPAPRKSKPISLSGTFDHKQHPTNSARQPYEYNVTIQTLDLPDDDLNGIYAANIANADLYCTANHVGIFQGIIFNDHQHPDNPNSMVIFNLDRQPIGYIPLDELPDYNRWCNAQPRHCVGYIKSNTTPTGLRTYYGRVYAIRPCNADFIKRKQKELITKIKKGEL